MDPDPNPNSGHDYFFKSYWNCLTKQNCQIIFPLFFAFFVLKLDEPFRDQEIFSISLFSTVQWFVEVFSWYFAPWIRIQEAKLLQIQRIRILNIG